MAQRCDRAVVTVAEETAPSVAAQPPVLDGRRRNVAFVTIMLGMLLAALDQTIVGTALPTIVSDLGGAEHMSWVVTSYLLAETVTIAKRLLVEDLNTGLPQRAQKLAGVGTT